MDSELKIAFIGVFGTLAGTFLGWMLNELSQKGKLNVFIESYKEDFQYNEVGYMTSSKSIEQTECFLYDLVLDLYNSSDKTKILRNVSVVFNDGKYDLHKSIPLDEKTKRYNEPTCYCDEITHVNIPPKTIIELKLHNCFWLNKNESDFIWKTKKVYLMYTDEKNKGRKILIKNQMYCDYFKSNDSEEE